MTIDTFLFDLDGTLVDSAADLATAVNLLRDESGLPPLELAQVRSYVGDGAAMLIRRALPERAFSADRLSRFLLLYEEHLLDQTVPYPGISSFLELHEGEPMAVVTNKPYRHTHAILQRLDLLSFFPVIVGGECCPERKPHPAPVLEALRRLGTLPSSAVLIGDHHTDLQAGRAAGVSTCFCTWGIGRDGGMPYDFIAGSPAELARLFPRREL